MPSWGRAPPLRIYNLAWKSVMTPWWAASSLQPVFICSVMYHIPIFPSSPAFLILVNHLSFFSDLDRCDHFKTSSSFIYSVFSFTPNNSTNVCSSRNQQMGNARCYGDNLPTKCGPPSCWRCGPRLHLFSL